MVGKAYGGPIIMRVGERTGKSPRYAKDEFILAAPGTVIAPRPKGVKPTLENAARAILKQALKTKVPGAQLGGLVKRPAGGGGWGGPGGTNPMDEPININLPFNELQTRPEGPYVGGFLPRPTPLAPAAPGTMPSTAPISYLDRMTQMLGQLGLSPEQIQMIMGRVRKVPATAAGTPDLDVGGALVPPGGPGALPGGAQQPATDYIANFDARVAKGLANALPGQNAWWLRQQWDNAMIMGLPSVQAYLAAHPEIVVPTSEVPYAPPPGGAAGAAIPMFNQVQSAVAGPQLPAGAPPAHQDIVNRLSAVTNMLSGSPATQPLAQRLAQVQSRIVGGYGQQQAIGPRYLPR